MGWGDWTEDLRRLKMPFLPAAVVGKQRVGRMGQGGRQSMLMCGHGIELFFRTSGEKSQDRVVSDLHILEALYLAQVLGLPHS